MSGKYLNTDRMSINPLFCIFSRHTEFAIFLLRVALMVALSRYAVPSILCYFSRTLRHTYLRAAYKASDYLEGLTHRGAIISQSSPELDVIYTKYAPRQVNSPIEPYPVRLGEF